MTRLICLHGFTQNGAVMRARIDKLLTRLLEPPEWLCPDAPHACSQNTVDRLYAAWNLERQSPPYLCWWDATDDGRLYRGWETTRERLTELCRADEPPLLLGFSQGATVAASLAALSAKGEFPTLSGVVLVAGRMPRSDALQPLFAPALAIPSLHVWGERDAMTKEGSAQLVERFDAAQRQVVTWLGPHALPVRGEAAQAIVDFIQRVRR